MPINMPGNGKDQFESAGLLQPLALLGNNWPPVMQKEAAGSQYDDARQDLARQQRNMQGGIKSAGAEMGERNPPYMNPVYYPYRESILSAAAFRESILRNDAAFVISESVALAKALQPHAQRESGPIRFVKKLLETWKLDGNDAVALLGFEQSDQLDVDNLLNGRTELKGRDVKDRIAHLFQIRRTLSALFRSEDVENEWLREPHSMLGEQVPMKLLLEGGMENLLLVREYVDAAAGR